MEKLKGIASNLSNKSPVSDPSAKADKVAKIHALYFQLDGRSVKFASPHKPNLKKINDGDQLVVVGTTGKSGLVELIAFKNITTGVEYSGWILWLFGGALFTWIGIANWPLIAQSSTGAPFSVDSVRYAFISEVCLFFGFILLFFSAQSLWAVIKLYKSE